MKSILLQPGGQVAVAEVPSPQPQPGRVLVRTRWSLISAGTELSMIAARRQGNGDSGQPHPLGYNACGVVEASDLPEFHPGQAVAVYGGPYVHHSEFLSVPRHLVQPVPPGVSLEAAATVGLGAIAIHAVRQAGLSFGEQAAVIGAGLLGNLVAQVCQAAAYQTLVTDVMDDRLEQAARCGLKAVSGGEHAAVREAVLSATGGHGADAVFVCAGGADAPFMDRAVDLVRYRGRVVIVGNVQPHFEREPFFQKEAAVLISRAGGPGRYDPQYEAAGIDYPYGLVRWTEGRNMGEYLRLAAAGLVRVDPLITHRFPVAAAPSAYQMLEQSPRGSMAVLFDWSRKEGITGAGTQG